MTTLLKKQFAFSLMVAELIRQAESLGYQVTLGEAWRTPEEAKRRGFPKSLHGKRLAIDINLFDSKGKFLVGEAGRIPHSLLHNFWDHKGGAERIETDLNHYSLGHEGVR